MNNFDTLYSMVLEKLAANNQPKPQEKVAQDQQLDAIYAAVMNKLASIKVK